MPQEIGIDYILGGMYRKAILKAHPPGWMAGFLWKASWIPSSKKVIRQLCASGKCPRMRISLVWDDNHTFKKKHVRLVKKRAKALRKIIFDYPQIYFYVQPFLEPHHVDDDVNRAAIKALKNILPADVVIVTGDGFGGRGIIHEGHHAGYRGQQIFSFDGLDCMESNVQTWKHRAKDAYIFFLWRRECNGNPPGPKRSRLWRRMFGDWLTKNDIIQMVFRWR